jgi:N,N'-diacetyllegionaminate synthase
MLFFYRSLIGNLILKMDTKVFIIAEIGQAHDGSLGIAHSYIDALKYTGVDAVKFQVHIAEAESSRYELFRVNFSYEDETRYDYWKRMEFTPSQWKGLKEHCDKVGLEFLASPFSITAVDLLEDLNVKRYKIGSGEVTNFLLLQRIASTGKPIIVSSGMSAVKELDEVIDFLKSYPNALSLLQCTTAYPTAPEDWGLNVIGLFRERFGLDVGFSDHSGDVFACLAAAALGAAVLEFHVVFDKRMFGPDAKASLTIEQTKELVRGVREIERAIYSPVSKTDDSSYTELKTMFGKSLCVNKPLSPGHIITLGDLESKKPAGYGISAKNYSQTLGKILRRKLAVYEFLNFEDIE